MVLLAGVLVGPEVVPVGRGVTAEDSDRQAAVQASHPFVSQDCLGDAEWSFGFGNACCLPSSWNRIYMSSTGLSSRRGSAPISRTEHSLTKSYMLILKRLLGI